MNKFGVVTKHIFKLSDSQILPSLLYVAKSGAYWSQTIFFLKLIHMHVKKDLTVSLWMPHKSVYGEVGRFPLVVNCCVRVIRYWFRPLKMNCSGLLYQAYQILCTLDGKGKKNCVTTGRHTLSHLWYGFVWLNQGVATEQPFTAQRKQRFIDVYSQEWMASLRGSTRFDTYILFKTSVRYEMYLDCIRVKYFRDALVRFRLWFTELKHSQTYIKTSSLVTLLTSH